MQFANALSKISRVRRHEPRQERHRAADGWIRRRVIRFSSQVWNLEAVRIDRHVPRLGQIQGRTGMIPMSMCEQNRFGSRPGAKPCLGGFENLIGSARKALDLAETWDVPIYAHRL